MNNIYIDQRFIWGFENKRQPCKEMVHVFSIKTKATNRSAQTLYCASWFSFTWTLQLNKCINNTSIEGDKFWVESDLSDFSTIPFWHCFLREVKKDPTPAVFRYYWQTGRSIHGLIIWTACTVVVLPWFCNSFCRNEQE
mgnify:CR=1 FL=1